MRTKWRKKRREEPETDNGSFALKAVVVAERKLVSAFGAAAA